MKRVILPVNKEKLSEDFEKADRYELFEILDETIVKKVIKGTDNLLKWIDNRNDIDIISNKINSQLIKILCNTKVNLFIGIPINKTNKIITDYLNGNLRSNTKMIIRKKEALIDN